MHKPVLVNEIIKELQPQNGGLYIDATFGGGGYSKAIKTVAPKSHIIAFDRDPFVANSTAVKEFSDEFYNIPFSCIQQYVTNKVDGVLFDFGVSSFQIDSPDRGFSFQKEGPLDMRMSQVGKTARDVVNTFTEKELADIIYYYGEETRAFQIAKAIVNNRPFETTLSLANIISKILPKYKIHPATKTFQALRIFVNNELEEIKLGIKGAISVLKENGLLMAVTFHGLEVRTLKEATKELKKIKKIASSRKEQLDNKRSRSAYLHIFQKRTSS